MQHSDHQKDQLINTMLYRKGLIVERCHGPGEIHVEQKLAGNIVDTSKYIDYTIVNPSKLPLDLQFDVCQRCHLQGTVVLTNGSTFNDFSSLEILLMSLWMYIYLNIKMIIHLSWLLM